MHLTLNLFWQWVSTFVSALKYWRINTLIILTGACSFSVSKLMAILPQILESFMFHYLMKGSYFRELGLAIFAELGWVAIKKNIILNILPCIPLILKFLKNINIPATVFSSVEILKIFTQWSSWPFIGSSWRPFCVLP